MSLDSGGVDAIFYDLDGTLADSGEGIEWAARGAVQAAFPGREIGPMRHLIGPPISIIFASAFREGGHAEMSPEELRTLESIYRALYDSEGCSIARAFPGVRDGLERRQALGVRQFVVTNKPRLPTQKMLAALDLAAFIEQAVSPDSVEPKFAHKGEAALWLLRQEGLDARRVLLVGDARDDALAARFVGARFVAAAWGYGEAAAANDLPLWQVTHEFGALRFELDIP